MDGAPLDTLISILLIGIIFGGIYFSSWIGKLLFRFLLPHIEKNIEYFYKKLLIKFAVKGITNGILVGQFIFVIMLVFSFGKELLTDTRTTHTTIDEVLKAVHYLQDKSHLNIIVFWILFVILGILLFVWGLLTIIGLCYYIGSIVGGLYGFCINIIIGLLFSIFYQIKETTFSLFNFKFDLQTIISTAIVGFTSGLLLLKGNLLISGLVGILTALVIKYLDKIKSQFLFYLSQKGVSFVLAYEKIFILTAVITIILLLSIDKTLHFDFIAFISKIFFYVPFCLLLLNFERIKKLKFVNTFLEIRDEEIERFFDRLKVEELPKNILLLIFAGLLSFILTFFATLKSEYNWSISIWSIVVTIIIIEKKPRIWLFIVWAFVSVALIANEPYYLPYLFIWALFGHLILHLLKLGDNGLDQTKIENIKEWIFEEGSSYK